MTIPDFVSDKRTARHTLRTAVQVLLSLAVAIPTAMTTLHISAALAAKVTGAAGAFVVIVTAVMNALEEAGVIKTILPNPTAVTVDTTDPNDGSGDGGDGGDSGSAVDQPPPDPNSPAAVVTGMTLHRPPPVARQVVHPGLLLLPPPVQIGKLGKLRKRSDPRDFKIGRYLVRSAIGTAPGHVRYDEAVARFSRYTVLLNDRLGDCGIASPLHQVQTWQADVGVDFTPTDAEALTGYEAVGGYVPGRPETDQGVYLRDMLNYWRKTGIANGMHKILAYAALNPTNHDLLKACIAIFGGVSMGFNLPVSVQGKDHWSVGRGAAATPGSWGGHAVPAVGYDSKHIYVVSWGAVYPVTLGFVDRYADEAWATVSAEFIGQSGRTPAGLDLGTLQADLTKV